MGIQFNAEEIFAIAEQMERNGAAFYKKAAKLAEDSKISNKLLELADMESEHERTFSEIKAQLTRSEKGPTVFDPEDELGQYLHAMAQQFPTAEENDPEKLVSGKSMQQILKTAISLEKDSIVFYLGLRDFVTEAAGRERVEWIIKQEKSHIVMLSTQLRSL